MLPDRVRKQVGFTMWFTCLLKFCPYTWDNKAFRLRKGNRIHQFIHRSILLFEFAGFMFSLLRLLQMYARGAEPRPFIMAMLFTVARLMEMTCYYQFLTNGDDIMYFANQVFAHLDEYRKKIVYEDGSITDGKVVEVKQKWKWDMTTICVIMSSMLVLGNPPAHALMLVNTPCVSHFLSSVILDCSHDMDNTHTFLEVLPLIVMENFLVTSMLQIITMNWTLIFLGSAWIKHELKLADEESKDKSPVKRERSRARFRKSQVLVSTLNNSFRTYLSYSPSLLLVLLTLLVFSTIRYSDFDMTSFIMYPLCAARCAFESFSLLAWAGQVNKLSLKPLETWKRTAIEVSDRKYDMVFGQSCRPLSMAAGSYYAFESTIVLTTINCCTDNTVNLLVTYK